MDAIRYIVLGGCLAALLLISSFAKADPTDDAVAAQKALAEQQKTATDQRELSRITLEKFTQKLGDLDTVALQCAAANEFLAQQIRTLQANVAQCEKAVAPPSPPVPPAPSAPAQ